jgi:hypothetical protein
MGALVIGCAAPQVEWDGEAVYQGFVLGEGSDLISLIEVVDVDSQVFLHLYYDDDRVVETADFVFEGHLSTPLGCINDQIVEDVGVEHRVGEDGQEEMFGSFVEGTHNTSFVGVMSDDEAELELEITDNLIRMGVVTLRPYEPEPEPEPE